MVPRPPPQGAPSTSSVLPYSLLPPNLYRCLDLPLQNGLDRPCRPPPPPCPGPAAAGNESAFITPNVSGVEGFSGDNSVYCQGPRNKVWKRSLQGLRSCERGGWRRHNHTQRSSEEPSSSSRHWTHGETAAPCTLAVEEWKPRSVCQIPEGGQSQGLFRADAGGHMWSARSPRAKQDGC